MHAENCPYCNVKPVVVDMFGLFQIRCPLCAVKSSCYEEEKEAVENFNKIVEHIKEKQNANA